MSANEIEEFINSTIICWLESCLPHPEIMCGYVSLLDGAILHSVYLQIDPEPQHHPTKIKNLDGISLLNARSKNFDVIVKNLRNLYDEELGQTVLVLPDCSILGMNPESRAGLEQMKLLITLLLGAAVQCPNKEIFIARIKELDVDTQHAIVEVIKQVTDNQSLVLTQESIEQLTPDIMCNHIMRLAKERDQYHSKWMATFNSDVDSMNSSSSKNSLSNSSSIISNAGNGPSASSENNHLAVELADYKSKLRKLRQELEEKSESLMEVKEELEHKTNQYEKLRSESQELYTEARRANSYRDEVDVLRERAERADRLELEVQKLREKLTDAEFYKTRVEELREDNKTLVETKEILEDQLIRSRKRNENAMVLESEIIKYKQKLNDMSLERDVHRTKLQELLDENHQLQLATKNLMAGPDVCLNSHSSDSGDDAPSNDNSLSEQLTNNAQTRALKLELENRRLLAALENMKESAFHESSNKILELEKDKKKLSLKLDQIQDNSNRLMQQNSELENVFKNALEENKKLQDSLESKQQSLDKQSHDREMDRMKMKDLELQIESGQKEKQRIQNLCESVQRRTVDLERSIDARTKEINSLNEKLKDLDALKKDLYDLNAKLSGVEKENINLSRDVVKYKESLEKKSVDLDSKVSEIEQLSKEVIKLNKNVEEAKNNCNKLQDLEKHNQELMSQTKISAETISTLQKDLYDGTLATKKVKQNLERLGLNENDMEKTDINVENIVEKLCKNPESFKTVREIILNVGKDMMKSADICVLCHRQEIYTVEKDIEFSNVDATNEMEIKLEQLKSENSSLQQTNETLQAENARQKVEVSTLGSQITSLNTQQIALQLANSQLAAEKDSFVKQVEARKVAYESLSHDQVTLQCLHEQLSSEYEALSKEKEILRNNIRDLKSENRDLKEQTSTLEKCVEKLRLEIESLKKGSVNLGNLRAEHSKLKEDFRNLFTTSEKLKHEYKNIQEQYRNIRSENSRLKLQNTELSGDLNNRMEQITSLEIDFTKINQRCEMLLQMNTSLGEDRRSLLDHVSQLLSQYHELLGHSLEDKQHYHVEEKNLTDRLNNLNRQKEKLEEKIMEHYKKLDSCSPKKKAFGSSFVKKVRKAGTELMNRVPNRNRRSWVDDSRLTQSQFTLGSESGGNESDNSVEEPNSVASDTNLLHRNSHLRQSLQRKPNTEMLTSTLMRGGPRSSLQASRREDANPAHRNSFQGFDTASDTLNLGTAGTRRTVYLVEENAIKNEIASNNSGSPTPTPPAPALPATAPPPVSVGGNTESNFVLLNRITTIKGVDSPQSSKGSPTHSANAEDNKKDNSKKKTEQKNRESAIWYEYGCV